MSLKDLYPHLANIKAVEAAAEDGPMVAIMAGFNFDPPLTEEHVHEALNAFLAQRMMMEEATGLLITIIGDISAADFARRWRQRVAIDEAAQFFMGQMRKADVMRGTPAGEVLESVSLLPDSR